MKKERETKVQRGARPGPPKNSPRPPSLNLLVASVREQLGEDWLPRHYRQKILTLRTRAYRLGATTKASPVEIQHTLLGVELKIGKKRLSCPDLATARYLTIFARLGNAEVAVPYDITQLSRLADELESAWQRMLLLVEHLAADRSRAFRARLVNTLTGEARAGIDEAGPGTIVPRFNQNTRQRPLSRGQA